LTYEVLYALKLVGMGSSTCVGIGGDPVNGTNFNSTPIATLNRISIIGADVPEVRPL
jgi:succinyl-CoA synthetase alpha subunit